MEWKTVKLGDVCDLIAGFAFKAGDFGDYPQKVVKIGDINPPHVTYASMSGIDLSKYDVKKLEKFKVQYGDYVLAMTGATIGKVGKYIDSAFSYLNQRVLMFKPKPEVDAQFVNYVVCSAYFRQYVMNHIDSESAQPNISATTIGKYEFLLPSLDEQHRIATILSSLDDKIENNNRINRNLEAQAQALFKSWFVDFEPFGGTMPEDWREYQLSELADVVGGYSYKGSELMPSEDAMATIKNFDRKGYFKLDGYKEIQISGRFKNTQILNLFDVVVAHTDITQQADIIGNPAIILSKGSYRNIIMSMDLCKVQPTHYAISSAFLYCLLKDSRFKSHALGYVNGTTVLHMSKKALPEYKVFLPSNLTKVQELGDQLQNLYKRYSVYLEENQRLAALRDTLLPKLMKGEIAL